ncbi:ABC transporter permease [Dietzia timorensis]|uniref:Uncharacterized protein n=1 Tax=Dietzia timorensis TaxID=499555 RepID=A0A173LGK9_9ACTN|nr:hypothetical protein [Dietzia timorensis]ANI91003.1 Hypothetical protein BJL86_0192 [Dietzia timorensis]
MSPIAGTATLLRLMARRDRIRTPAWIAGIVFFAAYVTIEVAALGDDPHSLANSAVLFADAMGRLMTGPALGLDAPSSARFFAAGYALFVYILFALMAIFTVIRHTRADEQSGRTELVRANVVGIHAQLTSALIITAFGAVVSALGVFAVALARGYPAGGSALIAITALAVALFFAGVAALSAQLFESSRAASGLAGAVLATAYALRMIGDAARSGGSPPSWLSPLGWAQQTGPFVLDRWWPLALLAGFGLAFLLAGFRLAEFRDVGSAIFSGRPGRATGGPVLGTPLGLAARLLRPGFAAWGISLAIAAAVFGAYSASIAGSADTLPEELTKVLSADDLSGGYLAFMVLIFGVFASAAAAGALGQLRGDELRGRTELLLASGAGRGRHLAAQLTVIAAASILICLATGLATGVGAFASGTDDTHVIADLLLAGANQIPAVLAVIGIVVAFFGSLPRFAAAAGWAVIGFGGFVTAFGELLDLPQPLKNLNVFGHVAAYPVDPVAWQPIAWLLLIAAAGVAAGFAGWSRREVDHA